MSNQHQIFSGVQSVQKSALENTVKVSHLKLKWGTILEKVF